MAIYAIADLHLSFKDNKPMDIFGDNWEKHTEKLRINWLGKVKNEDTVILPGDFSWAMYLKDTDYDFKYLSELPGKKILLKGNHDYWWNTINKMKKFLKDNNFSNIDFLYNNSFLVEDKIIVGTRGWNLLEIENDKKMIKRENIRLELSIQDGINKYGKGKEIIAFMHYPPISKNEIVKNTSNEFIETLEKYDIHRCYYGHLHGYSHKDAVEGSYKNINFYLISADYLNFHLIKV